MRLFRQPRFLGHTPSTSPRRPPLLLHALPPPQPSDVVFPHLLRFFSATASVSPRLLLPLRLLHSHPMRRRRRRSFHSLPLSSLPGPYLLLLLPSFRRHQRRPCVPLKWKLNGRGKRVPWRRRERVRLLSISLSSTRRRGRMLTSLEKPPLSSPAVIKSRNRNRVLPRMAI
ncbi:unnamed protein product [Brassica oleracea var. botrytis]|uniref:(rape) hypothetical protein n=1 Tax=Brassica napus TaxID=3708 RepID=A0A078H0H4_BRANA|nr:unnamed protein product [Brassica napus]CDY32185.1 BnaCnng06940D [Brassica napus]